MSTITLNGTAVKLSTTSDQQRTAAAQAAHEQALLAVDKAISACKRLALTGDSAAANEARLLAELLHRVSDPLYQTSTPVYRDGEWVR